MGCLQNVGSRKRSKFAFCLGPAFWRIHFSHVLFKKKNQGGLIASAFSLKLLLVSLPVLIFLKLKKTPGKVRNGSETGQKHQKGLPSIHPSIHLISYHCYFYFYYYYYYFYYFYYYYYLLPTNY